MNNTEAFEAWAEPELYALDKREGSDIYRNVITRNAWIGWQAALASQAQQPNAWQQAIDDELVNAHLGIAKDGITREEAKAELNKLIAWHIDAAKYFESQAQQEPYAYEVETDDGGIQLVYAIYFNKYNNPLPEGAIPLYTSQQEPVRPWICPNFMLPPRSEEVLVYPMPNNVAHTAFHDGECWRVTEYENNYGYSLVALPDGFIKGWMPIPPAPEVCSDGGKCGAGGYCITCPNMPAPEGDKP